jgi:hypothetical protein
LSLDAWAGVPAIVDTAAMAEILAVKVFMSFSVSCRSPSMPQRPARRYYTDGVDHRSASSSDARARSISATAGPSCSTVG